MYSNKENINILTSLLVEYGVRHVVCCPGSRNGALVHNFNECPLIECHPVTDERSAAFVALGMRLELQQPVAVCVTSGTALLNTLPAVAEASYQKQGIIIISADRPQEWVNQLDGQTISQPGSLGEFVCASVQLADTNYRQVCGAFIQMQATGKSIHINVPLAEPLFEFTTPTLPTVKAVNLIDATKSEGISWFSDILSSCTKPMIVIGQCGQDYLDEELLQELADRVVILSEPISTTVPSPSLDCVFEAIGSNTLPYTPDLLLYIGGNTISKKMRLWMRTLTQTTVILHNDEALLQDPSQQASYVVRGDINKLLNTLNSTLYSAEQDSESLTFLNYWKSILLTVQEQTAETYDTLHQAAVFWLEKNIEPSDRLHYANSSAIRMAAKYAHHYVYCNRGINGIEGSLSTAVGASLVTADKVFCVIGDLSFFYDQNALWNQYLCNNLRILLLNNGGGDIFNRLPGLNDSPAAEDLIKASHQTTAEHICQTYNIEYRACDNQQDLPIALEWLTSDESDRPMLVEVKSEK